MPKRNGSSQLSRKRRKAGASYEEVDGDASSADSEEVESIRVWSITTSETTGRVSGRRTTHRHLREDPVEPRDEEPPALEEVGPPADSEPSDSLPAKVAAKGKRKRVRVTKENDSVSFVPMDNVFDRTNNRYR